MPISAAESAPREILRRGFIANAARIGEQLTLRADPKFRFLADVEGGLPVVARSAVPRSRLRDCLLPYAARTLQKGTLPRERRMIELADVEPRTSIVLTGEAGAVRTVTDVGSAKLDFADCDLVVTRLRPYLGKVVLNDPRDPYIGTSEWIPLKLRRDKLDPVFAKYLLLLPPYLAALRGTMSGKQHPRTSAAEVYRLVIPLPPLERQRETAHRLLALERELISEHRRLPTRNAVVDAVFVREFGYDLDVPRDTRWYERGSEAFGTSLDLRGGVRFLSPRFDPLRSVRSRVPHSLFRDILAPSVRLGATIHPGDYDDDGEARYVSPGAIRTGVVDLDLAHSVTEDFYRANSRLYGVRGGDLIIARSGEGTIGKAALVAEESGPAIFSDFTMRARARSGVDPEYLYYFCCSRLFVLQVEQAKRGMGNMTNFFPNQLLRFWIVRPPAEQQRRLVEQIRAALAARDEQRATIERLREEMDSVVMESFVV